MTRPQGSSELEKARAKQAVKQHTKQTHLGVCWGRGDPERGGEGGREKGGEVGREKGGEREGRGAAITSELFELLVSP